MECANFTFPRTVGWNVLECANFIFPRTIGWNVLECAIFTLPKTIGRNVLECANFVFPRTIGWNVLEFANLTLRRRIGWNASQHSYFQKQWDGMFSNTVKYNGLERFLILESLSADPLWELEHCKIQGFGAVPHFGITLCRSSLGAGTL